MKLTRFSDYSLRILMFAALRDDLKFSVEEVAKVYGLSRHHAAKAVNFLTQSGYLRAQRGRGGGIRLGQKPHEICIGHLVRQTERGSPLVECFDAGSNTCPLIHACLLKQALGQAWTAFFKTLDRYTLADLVHKPGPLRRALALNA
jgi:Rrf2 family transcriptional regulator, nitric oxide-sensitive transcriptional repressor